MRGRCASPDARTVVAGARRRPGLAEAIGAGRDGPTAIRCMGYRGFAKSVRGEMAPEHMVLKLFSSEAEQRACEVAGMPWAPTASISTGRVRNGSPTGTSRTSTSGRQRSWARSTTVRGPTQYWRSFSHTIAGGTSEIQRNIIAERCSAFPGGELSSRPLALGPSLSGRDGRSDRLLINSAAQRPPLPRHDVEEFVVGPLYATRYRAALTETASFEGPCTRRPIHTI